jgi:hypothetical protein
VYRKPSAAYSARDGQYDPREIPKLVRAIANEGYYVAIGRDRGSESFSRRFISEVFKKLTKTLLGLEYVQTGFKAGVRKVLLDTIPEGVSGLDIDLRWMNNVVRKGYGNKLSDDVEVRLYPRLHGKTTFNPLKLSLGLLYTTVSLALERKTGRELPFPRVLKELTLQPEGARVGLLPMMAAFNATQGTLAVLVGYLLYAAYMQSQ